MANPFKILHKLGQSLWYDNIQRKMLENGELAEMIARGELRGMTSNPSIFNQAIAESTDYDLALKTMAWSGYTARQILDHLMIEDIRAATDLFLPLYEESERGDGFVSIEVSPDLAYDTDATIAEARRLWDLVGRENLMVKIPATEEGLPAIRESIAEGINVNITLIFSIARYKKVMDAYLAGLEKRVEAGLSIENISSVASFFVSRIDSNVDKRLEKIVQGEGPQAQKAAGLLGKTAVDSARLAYALFKEVFGGPRWERLKEKGARIQRPLWASTSTKNPAYPELKYVEELIGAHTVNTVPEVTLEAIRAHANDFPTEPSVENDLNQARQDFETLEELGISIDEVTQELEDEGVKKFIDAAQALLNTIETRCREALAELGPLEDYIPGRVLQLQENEAPARMWMSDPRLWTSSPEGEQEIRKRLGWLSLPEKSWDILPEIYAVKEAIQKDGYTHALLLGMGGSSLAPEVLSKIFSSKHLDGLELSILDSTDPAQVKEAMGRSPVEKTLYIVSSKSGTTAEVSAFLDTFWEQAQEKAGDRAAEHFVAVTDPGTPLEELASQRGFRHIFLADPMVGGRYSALSAFGLVPAGLMGIDAGRLLTNAALMARQMSVSVPAGRNPGLVLGAILGEAALHGRDKLTLVADSPLGPFGSWLEQLVAESSGKQGKGVVPVDGEPVGKPDVYGRDRLFIYFRRDGENDEPIEDLRAAGHPVVTLQVADNNDLGGQFYLWEFATAISGAVIGFNPFDQPDVQDSKNRTKAKIKAYREEGKLETVQPDWEGKHVSVFELASSTQTGGNRTSLSEILKDFLAQAKPGDYVALNAYLPREPQYEDMLQKLRTEIRAQTDLATTVGFGPRFLHSTGQLHKGGPNSGLFLQITADPEQDMEIPTEGLSFGVMEQAQAQGDLEALQARDRRLLRLHLKRPEDLQEVVQALE